MHAHRLRGRLLHHGAAGGRGEVPAPLRRAARGQRPAAELQQGLGVAAAKQEAIKEGKYSEVAAAKGIRFIPFAMETYGKLGTKALRLLRTLGQDLADSNQPSALRPWHARSFMDSAVQRLSVALQEELPSKPRSPDSMLPPVNPGALMG